MITVYTWKEAPEELKALSNHGGDEEHVIVANGFGNIEEIMEIRDMFDAVIRGLDVWELGRGTVHEITVQGEAIGLVYITAHA